MIFQVVFFFVFGKIKAIDISISYKIGDTTL